MTSSQHPPTDLQANPFRSSTSSIQYRKRHLEPSSPEQFQSAEDIEHLPRLSNNRRSIASTTSLRPFGSAADYHSLPPPKPSKSNLTVTSPGWDPIGDDDALYIQSDDTHLRDLAGPGSQRSTSNSRSARLDQALLQARKRKRTTSQQPSQDRSQPAPQSSTSSQPFRGALKHDAEGCSNCRTKQSICWYKKKNPEEKLCNPCSVHWNKNGYHRSVRTKAPKQINQQPRPAIIPTRSSSSRPRRSCPSEFNAGLSSPTASITKVHSNLTRNLHRSRSPSQLTLAAEREARIVKKSVAKAHAKSHALRQRKEIPKFGYISEEEDELYDNPQSYPPLPPPRPTKHSSRKNTRSISQKIDAIDTSVGGLSPRDTSLSAICPGDASSSYNLNQHSTLTETIHAAEKIFDSFLNYHMSSEPHLEPPQEDIYISPPRTPPPNNHQLNPTKNPSQLRNSPGQLFDFGNILSPSFLNGSPNSLLRRLNAQKHLIDASNEASNLSTSRLSSFPPGMPDKVFSPSRFMGSSSKSKPLPPVAEPVKKPDMSPPNTLGSAGLLDAHLNSGSSERSFIFSPSRSAPKSEENELQTAGRKSNHSKPNDAFFSEFPNPIPGPSKARRHRKISTEAGFGDLQHSLDFSRSINPRFIEPMSPSSKTATGSSRKKTQPSTSNGQLSKPTKQTMARTIWSRRLETTGVSSEDSQLEELFGKPSRGQSPLESRHSEGRHLKETPMERTMVEESGLSSVVFRGLHGGLSRTERGRLGSGIGHSESQMLSTSSPPVLPPPSDCSEGITPHSGEPASDEPEKEPETKAGRLSRTTAELSLRAKEPAESGRFVDYELAIDGHDQGPLADITHSLNRPLGRNLPQPSSSHRPGRTLDHDPKSDGLSPEIIAALSQALNAGISADEIADALRTLDDPSLPFTSNLPVSNPPSFPTPGLSTFPTHLPLDPNLANEFPSGSFFLPGPPITTSEPFPSLLQHHPQDRYHHPSDTTPFPPPLDTFSSFSTVPANSITPNTTTTAAAASEHLPLHTPQDFGLSLQDLERLFNFSNDHNLDTSGALNLNQ